MTVEPKMVGSVNFPSRCAEIGTLYRHHGKIEHCSIPPSLHRDCAVAVIYGSTVLSENRVSVSRPWKPCSRRNLIGYGCRGRDRGPRTVKYKGGLIVANPKSH
uniref:Ribosomal protein L2 n=1 Tax=Romanomermis culicivorax TaxID=13658 RepID=A0A915HFH3_ROMCU